MPQTTIISDEVRTVDAVPDAARTTFLLDPGDLLGALGWELKPSGLCRAAACVPVGDASALWVGDQLDVAAVAAALGRSLVVDVDAGLVAVSLPSEQRRRALDDLVAPWFELPDLEGTRHGLDEWRGAKKLLVTFASWCGCRYDLPGWQALHDELSPFGFTVLAVAVDHAAEDVRPWADGITMPVLIDAQHLLTELYAISNVPTVVWIDGDDRIVRPNGYAFGSDTFTAFTGVESSPHLAAVRRWVLDGTVPIGADEARRAVQDLSSDEIRARLHFRVASEALRRGNEETARRHLALAGELAPGDLTIWRAAMPLVGEDPFGDTFFARYEQWQRSGSPYHGLPAVSGTEPVVG